MDAPTMQRRLQAKGIKIAEADLVFTLLTLNDAVFKGVLTNHQKTTTGQGSNHFNIQKMQSILLAKGIRIADDDPLFTLLAMNEISLEDMCSQYQKMLDSIGSSGHYWKKRMPAYLQAIVGLVTAFTLGTFCRSDLSWLQGTLIAMTSVSFGWLLYLLSGVHTAGKSTVQHSPRVSESVQEKPIAKLWTEDEFTKATNAMASRLSTRTLKACLAVLVHGDDVESPAIKYFILPTQIRRAIRLLEKHKPSTRS